MKKWQQTTLALAAPILLGVFVSLCGILLSLGFKKLSVLFFFASVTLLGVMQLWGRLLRRSSPGSKD